MPSPRRLRHRLDQCIVRVGRRNDERGEMSMELTMITAALVGLTITAFAAGARILAGS